MTHKPLTQDEIERAEAAFLKEYGSRPVNRISYAQYSDWVAYQKGYAAGLREGRRYKDALEVIAAPDQTFDYGWWTELARKTLSSTPPEETR